MVENLLKRFEENLRCALFCYKEEIGEVSYESALEDMRKRYTEFVDMAFQMYLYDIIDTEQWGYLSDHSYDLRQKYVGKLIDINVERELSKLWPV